jgi:hypothetical protein
MSSVQPAPQLRAASALGKEKERLDFLLGGIKKKDDIHLLL